MGPLKKNSFWRPNYTGPINFSRTLAGEQNNELMETPNGFEENLATFSFVFTKKKACYSLAIYFFLNLSAQ